MAKAKTGPNPPCAYGCGNVGDGMLTVMFVPTDGNTRGEMHVSLWCCRKCLNGAVKVRLELARETSE